ncbi:MAG: precorrin-6y C5,15-methyltransferase (decarboxylating) subunit CbiE, partial [Candidatus Dormibacteraeota bacterium]|nr:precorrin-6y C5,15-methyltransferase (decarboxylating) subunit CbiE [Candidatus Dormibacteraeota bacterium]
MIAVVGIGLEGLGSASPRGRRLLEQAEVIVGVERHLALVEGCGGRRVGWNGSPSQLEELLAGERTERTVLLASGDPNLFGVGATLVERLGPEAVDIEPSVSSLQLALARARIPMAGSALVSAHGRPLAAAVGLAAASRRAAILTDPGHGPEEVAAALALAGVEPEARLVVCERLGGPDERVSAGTVASPPSGPFDSLSVVVLEQRAASGPGLGRPEEDYEHDAGLITKAEVRAIALAALDPGPEDVVWDVGAGSGSLAVEAGRLAARGQVYAVERRPERAERARRNAARSWNVEVLVGEASELLPGLPAPDAVFLGGGGDLLVGLVELSVGRLRERPSPLPGRLVAGLATIESVLDATSALGRAGCDWRVSQVSIARGRRLGGRLGWEALNPVH